MEQSGTIWNLFRMEPFSLRTSRDNLFYIHNLFQSLSIKWPSSSYLRVLKLFECLMICFYSLYFIPSLYHLFLLVINCCYQYRFMVRISSSGIKGRVRDTRDSARGLHGRRGRRSFTKGIEYLQRSRTCVN